MGMVWMGVTQADTLSWPTGETHSTGLHPHLEPAFSAEANKKDGLIHVAKSGVCLVGTACRHFWLPYGENLVKNDPGEPRDRVLWVTRTAMLLLLLGRIQTCDPQRAAVVCLHSSREQ